MKSINKEKYPREYRIWKAMRARCNAPCYKMNTYQVKGIKVCEKWNSFDNFIEDMGVCPDNYQIDRIDNDGHYCKENCRWATPKEQSSNRGDFNKIFTYNGQSMILKDWAKKLGIKYGTLYLRIFKTGLSFEESIVNRNLGNQTYLWNGIYYSPIELAKMYNIRPHTIVNRVKKHNWSLERALQTPDKFR